MKTLRTIMFMTVCIIAGAVLLFFLLCDRMYKAVTRFFDRDI
jgi:hypothetical protein